MIFVASEDTDPDRWSSIPLSGIIQLDSSREWEITVTPPSSSPSSDSISTNLQELIELVDRMEQRLQTLTARAKDLEDSTRKLVDQEIQKEPEAKKTD